MIVDSPSFKPELGFLEGFRLKEPSILSTMYFASPHSVSTN